MLQIFVEGFNRLSLTGLSKKEKDANSRSPEIVFTSSFSYWLVP